MRALVSAPLFSVVYSAALLAQTAAQPPAKKAEAPKAPATKAAAPATKAADTAKPVEPAKPARPNGLYGTMVTTMGTFKFELFEKQAPATVKNFIDLAKGRKQWKDPATRAMTSRPLYPGVTFHRVIPGFMVQTGDPTGTGAGDVGFNFDDEIAPDLAFDRPGRLGMATTGRPRSNSSQFFITEVPTPWLNGKHTIFGQVYEGVELVGKMARVPKNAEDKPATPIKIVSITFERVGPAPPNAPEGAPARPAPAKKAAPVTKAPAPAKKAATPAATPAKKQ